MIIDNKIHDGIIPFTIIDNKIHEDVTILLSYVNPIDSRRGSTYASVYAYIVRENISGILTSSQIHYRPPTHRPRRVPVLIAKFPDAVRYGNHAPPQAFAPSIECRFALVHSSGEAIIPTCIRRHTAFTTLILASAISSLRDTTRILALIQRLVIDPSVRIIG